jgi:hypothetical protein
MSADKAKILKLKPMVIFKIKPNGRITKKELPTQLF